MPLSRSARRALATVLLVTMALPSLPVSFASARPRPAKARSAVAARIVSLARRELDRKSVV